MTTIAVSIGRNVQDVPLSSPEWFTFSQQVQNVVNNVNGQIYGLAYGRGYWEGGSEDTFILLARVHSSSIEGVKAQLRSLAKRYGQEAIGLVVHNDGDNSVVVPST